MHQLIFVEAIFMRFERSYATMGDNRWYFGQCNIDGLSYGKQPPSSTQRMNGTKLSFTPSLHLCLISRVKLVDHAQTTVKKGTASNRKKQGGEYLSHHQANKVG